MGLVDHEQGPLRVLGLELVEVSEQQGVVGDDEAVLGEGLADRGRVQAQVAAALADLAGLRL